MAVKKEIKITCEYQKLALIEDLKDFQGKLKIITRKNVQKLKKLLKKYGFSFPVFVWNNYILDGHQRIKATQEMLEKGWTIEGIPVVEIHARDEHEAAEKLLAVTSQYGEATDDGLAEFIRQYDVSLDTIKDFDVPDVDLETVLELLLDKDEPSEKDTPPDNYTSQYGVIVICNDEKHQEDVYNFLNEKGYNCRVVNT